jgi:hypothetical protein
MDSKLAVIDGREPVDECRAEKEPRSEVERGQANAKTAMEPVGSEPIGLDIV